MDPTETNLTGLEMPSPDDIVRDKYKIPIARLKDLYETSMKSVNKLAKCTLELSDLMTEKDKFVIRKLAIDDEVKLIKQTLQEVKTEQASCKKAVNECEALCIAKEKKRHKFEQAIASALARVAKHVDKRDKIVRKLSKRTLKLEKSEDEK